MNPRLSVVIPAFNAQAAIAEAVRAIITQPVPRDVFECLVVDDGSRDRTAEAAELAGAVVVRLEKNRGRAAARNAGIERARGEWIAFTDADCVPSRRWLPCLLAAAAILITFVPPPFATWSNAEPNLSSRSRRRKRGASPSMVAFRSCCAVHSCVGFRLAATWTTRLDARWTMKNAYTWRKKMS